MRASPEDFGIGRLFRHIRDCVVVANAATERIVLWNDWAQTTLGYSEDEALDMPLHTLVPDELKDQHRNGIARYQETGQGLLLEGASAVELEAVHKDGRRIPVELSLTPIPEPNEEGHRFALAILRDISERKEAEAAKAKLQEAAADRRRALELNDTIVQGLAVAKIALESDRFELGLRSVTETFEHAKDLVAKLLRQIESADGPIQPGDLTVSAPEGSQEGSALELDGEGGA
ncbi:MAG TPA: PAS domain S-box protein [Actinomycetota bacterium]|nr:PAS domain S-box protein [Actinomycetota bacterium]